MRTLQTTERLINGAFPECSPEEQGLSSRAIVDFLDAVEARGLEMHGLQIIRNGYRIVSLAPRPLSVDAMHRTYSSAKAAVIATAALFAIQEGKLSFDDRLADLFPESVPGDISDYARQITVYDLMNMASGHDSNEVFYRMRREDDWVRGFLSMPPRHRPGTVFLYNNCCPHMVSNIVKKVTGQWMTEYLQDRFFEPLGIRVLCEHNWTGDLEPTTTCMSVASMARIAQFYLQKGRWDGRQLLSPALAGMMGRRHAPAALYPEELDPCLPAWAADLTERGGYGLFANCYLDGAQFNGGMCNHAFLFPRENMAVALFGNDRRDDTEAGGIKRLFMRHVLYRAYDRQLEDDGWRALLESRAARWSLAPQGAAFSEHAALYSGKTYVFDDNELGVASARIDFHGDGAMFHVKTARGDITAPCGLNGDWPEGEGYLFAQPDSSKSEKIRGYEPDRQYGFDSDRFFHSGAWTHQDTFAMNARSLSKSCTIRFTLCFSGRRLQLTANTHFLPGDAPESAIHRLTAWQSAEA